MDNLMQSNVFFFVTTIAVIIVTALLVTILVYALGIFRKIKKETNEIVKDVSAFRRTIEKWVGKKNEKKTK